MINFNDHESCLFSSGPNDCAKTVITFIIKLGLGAITCLYKMDSIPMPKVEDVRDFTRDLEYEYESSARLNRSHRGERRTLRVPDRAERREGQVRVAP